MYLFCVCRYGVQMAHLAQANVDSFPPMGFLRSRTPMQWQIGEMWKMPGRTSRSSCFEGFKTCRWPFINPRLVIPKNVDYHCLSVYHRLLDCNPVTERESMGVRATKGQWTSPHGALSRAELQWAQQRSNGKGTRWQSSKPRDDLEFDLKWTPRSSARWFWNCLWGQ